MVQPCGHFTWAANYEGRRRRAGRSDTLPLTLLGHDYVCYYGHIFWFGNITWKFTGMFTRCCFNLYVLEDSNLTSFDQANFLFDQATHLFIGTSTNYFFHSLGLWSLSLICISNDDEARAVLVKEECRNHSDIEAICQVGITYVCTGIRIPSARESVHAWMP